MTHLTKKDIVGAYSRQRLNTAHCVQARRESDNTMRDTFKMKDALIQTFSTIFTRFLFFDSFTFSPLKCVCVFIQLLNGLIEWIILVLIHAHPAVYTGIVLSHNLQQPGLRD